MKEFGFKGSADEFKAAGGDFWSMKSTSNGKTVEEMFAGGTAAGAQNTAAKIGTITGTFEDALSSVGEKMLNGLNPALDWLIEKSEGASGALEGALTAVGGTVSNLMSAVQPLTPVISTIGSVVGGVVSFAFSSLGSILNNLVIPIVEKVGSVFSFGSEVLSIFFPKMEGVGSAAEEVTKFFQGLGSVVNNVTGALGGLIDAVGDKIGSVKNWVLDKISGHATGGMAVGGLTQINENMKGELIRLPNGSRIYPYETTRKLLQREIGGNRRASNHNVITVNVDARGSNLTREQVYRLKREIVSDIVEAFDNMVPA